MKGMYMLPADTALTRRIIGSGVGTNAFHSMMPSNASIVLEGVATSPGQVDVLAVNADATQIRFAPGANKSFNLTLAKQVDREARAIAGMGAGGGPGEEVDVTLSPELSVVRLGNRGAARSVEARAFSLNRDTNTPINKKAANVSLPSRSDLLVAVPDWSTVDLNVQTLGFEQV